MPIRTHIFLTKIPALAVLAFAALISSGCGDDAKPVDKCANVTCTPSDNCHAAGTCDSSTGQCSVGDPKACSAGLTCDVKDGECKDLCAGVTCSALDQCHDAGVCNPASGQCSNPIKAPGTSCNDGNGCTSNDECDATGTCAGTEVTCQTPGDGQCQVLAGQCVATSESTYSCHYDNAQDGATCNKDSNGCTQDDHCQAGACTAGAAVVCTNTSNSCQEASGTCASTGNNSHTCSFTNKGPTTACNDHDGCTTDDRCDGAGNCMGTTVTCTTPLDTQCQTVAGTCNSTGDATYACNYGTLPDTTTCNADSNGCTADDHCHSGLCTAGAAVVCTNTSNSCQEASGTCASTGTNSHTCSFTNKGDGTACDDGNRCTGAPGAAVADQCQGGQCQGGTATVCADATCSTGGTCNPANGHCEGGVNLPITQSCDDGNPCTTSDHCDGNGACAGGAKCAVGQTCDSSGTCHATGIQADVVKDLQTTTPGSLATDAAGASYVVAGIALSNPVAFDGIQVASYGDTDVFLAKYDASGTAVWAFNVGDAANPQIGSGVAVTQDGTVAAIGQFTGKMQTGATPADLVSGLSASNTLDFLLAVNASNGAGKWGKQFDDGSNGRLMAVAANPNSSANRIAVCGISSAAATNLTGVTTFGGGNTDAVLAWFKSDGTAVKAFEFGNSGDETCNAVAIDDNGDVYATGQFNGATLQIGGVTLTGPGTSSRKFIWVAKFDGSSGAVVSAAAFNGTLGAAQPNSLTVDASGKLVMAGQFTSNLTIGTTLTSAGQADAFVAKLDPSAATMAPIWAVRMGSTSLDAATGVATTSFGDVVVVGYFNKTTTGVAALTAHGTSAADAFILKLNGGTGTADFASGYGDGQTQTADAVTVNRYASNQVVVAGTFSGTITYDAVPTVTAANGTDVYLTLGHLFTMP
jgi:hypothetical protein